MALAASVLAACTSPGVASQTGGSSSSPATRDTAAVDRAREVLGLIDRYGLYATGPDWQTAMADAQAGLDQAVTAEDTVNVLRKALSVGGGPHSGIYPNAAIDSAEAAAEMPTTTRIAGVTVLVVPGAEVDDAAAERYSATLLRAIADNAATTCGWIVDLRYNRGGNAGPIASGLRPLLPDGVLISYRDRTGQTIGQWRAAGSQILNESTPLPGIPITSGTLASAPALAARKPVAVLQAQMTASAAEVGVVMFHGLPYTRFFGEPTRGLSSANVGFDGPGDTDVALTGATYVDRSGRDSRGQPLPPDEPTPASSAQEAAQNWLRTQSCQ